MFILIIIYETKIKMFFFMDEELKGDTNMKLRIFVRYTQ